MTTPPGIRTSRRSSSPPGPRSLLPILLALVFVLLPVAPAFAQDTLEETDDMNKTAQSPDECVRPSMPGNGDPDVEGAMAYNESQQLYEECLQRTEGNEGGSEGGDTGGGSSGGGAIMDANENATQPEECVQPETPTGDGAGEGADFVEQREAYRDCLARTGDAGSGEEGGSGEESGGSTDDTGGSSECQAPGDDAPEEAQQAYEDCLAGSGELANDESTTAAPTDSSDDGSGGILGIIMDGFIGIMNKIWDWTFGWALEAMAEAFQSELLSLPTFDGNSPVLGFYTDAVDKIRPIILVGILILGILMMVRSDNYDLAYAGFQGLPKLIGIAIAFAFLPVFMGELARITVGISEAFAPSGGDINEVSRELFKASIGNMAVSNFLNLILLVAAAVVGGLLVVVAILNKLLYAILFVGGVFALGASIVPSFQSLAGSWFRGVVASAGIPALWSIELGIGSLVVTSPDAIFGSMTNSLGFISESAVTSIGAIGTMWVMYKTPFKCIEWAFNVQLPGRGGLVGLAKAGAHLAVATPLKTAVSQATKSLFHRSSGGGSIPTPRTDGSKSGGSKPGSSKPGSRIGEGKGGAARKIQHAQRQGQRSREAANVSKNLSSYIRQRDRNQEHKEKFMQGTSKGRPRKTDAPGLQNARRGKGSGSRQKKAR